ncbi:MAG: TonB-dependent receptor plug domain-containing protein [Treponema sp.]|nr:TonB-dependent receptor plug domain-containing protein [Treponema sp.]
MIKPKPALCAIILILLSAFPLFAHDVEITVIDHDLALPLEGAVVRLWDGSERVCNEEGKTVIQAPDNRQVVIQAAYPGYETLRVVIAVTGNSYTAALRLSGIMESRELVLEAERPGANETRTGRSVAVSGRDIAQTGEIGIIEDVMTSVKLLPGVGYAGFFNAQPSIRGGDPGDMRASLDGFYVFNPYHWGGGYSIFDPRMVESAQLSHGVYSARYGHSISGLLEITTKKPSPTDTQFELGVNTSAASFNLSLPLANKGGLLFMGRVTYYDPVVGIIKELSEDIPELAIINSVRVAPYIRSGAVTGNYHLLDNLELTATGFFGMDGVGASYENTGESGTSSMNLDWTNYQGFINSSLLWNPRNDMLLKFSLGAGYEEALLDGDSHVELIDRGFTSGAGWYYKKLNEMSSKFTSSYNLNIKDYYKQSDKAFNIQSRIDYDWDMGNSFLLAAGIQEMFNHHRSAGNQSVNTRKVFNDKNFNEEDRKKLYDDMDIDESDIEEFNNLFKNRLVVNVPLNYNPDVKNTLFITSGYLVGEHHAGKLETELGLRIDHFYLMGDNFSIQSIPALNPRLNFDFNVFKKSGFIQSLDLSAGTGLFSSVNNNIFIAEEKYKINEMKPNRSLSSVLGTKLEFQGGLIFNIEGYYKYIFDRMYVPISADLDDTKITPYFDGEGRAWGIDLLLQKLQSRYWDGWITYSYSWVKYRDPSAASADMGISGGLQGDEWYFPSYHRFHNFNLILNIKPVQKINIYVRFGIASGVQISKRITEEPYSYPVYIYNKDDPSNNKFIEMYFWPSRRDENNRTTPSLPMDVKISIFGSNKTGKARYELYVAVENILALLYNAEGNTSYNGYTGQVDTGSTSATYEIPVPVPSFGFKISY